MRLEDWRIKKELTYENLGRLLCMTTSKVYRICLTDNQCTRLIDAHRIIRTTGNEVSMEDLLPIEGDC